jgi:hypothetical protein
MSYSLGNILLLDSKTKSLVVLDTDKKTNTILAGPTQLGDAKYASINGDTAYVYSSDKGVLMTDINTPKVLPIIPPDPEWGQITDIYAFSGSIYLLDSIKNEIWKYVPVASGFSDKQIYIRDNQGVDFIGATKLKIDFSVWVLKPGPEIYRFTGGNLDNFAIGGLDKSTSDIPSFAVSEEKDEMYVLDNTNSRLLILNKNGEYQSEYTGSSFGQMEDVVVDDGKKVLYLLDKGTIYQLNLK